MFFSPAIWVTLIAVLCALAGVWLTSIKSLARPLVPFGGYGQSGLGREGGVDAIRDYTRSKSVWIRTSDEPIPDPFVMRSIYSATR